MNPFLTADYRDGRVRIDSKTYAAGAYAVHLLNQYYRNDTAARISVYKQYGWNVAEQLSAGYLKETDFISVGTEIGFILDTLPNLKPFSALDVIAERNRITDLFSENNAKQITDFFHHRSMVESKAQIELDLDLLPPEYDKVFFKESNALIAEIMETLAFYNAISTDMQKAYKQLTVFASRVDEANRFDEEHLLPIALEVFGSVPFPVTTEYVPTRKNAKSKTETLARRLYFDSYYSFIITDFFEGLHYGHYPRRCGVCKKYFLMTSARRQQYCMGIAPEQIRGQNVTCRRYAASMMRKEKAANDPISAIYTNRCSAIRTEVKRGTIPAEIGEAAKVLALEHKKTAMMDDNYAKKQYKKDMSREKLYHDAGLK